MRDTKGIKAVSGSLRRENKNKNKMETFMNEICAGVNC